MSLMAPSVDRVERPPIAARDELGRAIETGELAVWYQPVVRLSDGVVTGFEALVRWPHPHGAATPAAEIIPRAEAAGLLGALDDWVRQNVFRQLALWQGDALVSSGFHMALNMSAVELDDDELVERVSQEIGASGVDPRGLVFELTDIRRIRDIDAARAVVAELRQLGVDVAIADVGGAPAEVDLLLALPVNVLKIDRAVVEDMDTEMGAALAGELMTLGEGLHVRTLAGGVETIEQADRLRALGCSAGQGFLWLPALPADDAEHLLTACRPVLPRP